MTNITESNTEIYIDALIASNRRDRKKLRALARDKDRHQWWEDFKKRRVKPAKESDTESKAE